MPNRVIREAILTSDKVNALDWVEEIFFRRLLSIVDDFGRYDARASVLRCALYPLKLESMPEERVQACLDAVEAAGLVTVYTVDGKPYLEVAKFSQHVRAKKSRFPAPNNVCTADAVQMQRTCSANAAHVQCERSADEVQMQSECGADAQRMQRTCCTRARVTESESESEYIKKNRADNSTATIGAVAESARAEIDEAAYRVWVGMVAPCHAGIARCTRLPRDVEDAARDAFTRLPHAADEAELLQAYMADTRHHCDRSRKEFYRPEKGSLFFESLERVLLNARRWAQFMDWMPAAERKRRNEARKAKEGENKPMTDEELAANLAILHADEDQKGGAQ